MRSLLDRLCQVKSVVQYKPCPVIDNKEMRLPDSHLDFLQLSDGVMAYGGYFRIFGVKNHPQLNLYNWNASETWKFAWKHVVDGFYCFGETAWGDQYAYSISDMKEDSESKVFFLEHITMKPEVISDSFEGFLENEFIRNAKTPYDDFIVQVRNKIGDISLDFHIIHNPSLLVSSEERIERVEKMDSVTSMVINGDLFSALANQRQDQEIARLESYVDNEGRQRIRVLLKHE